MRVLMIGSHLRVTGGITRVVKNYIQAGIGDKVDFEYFPTYYGAGNVANIIYFILQYFKLVIRLNFSNKKYDVVHIHMSYKGSFIRKKYIIKLFNKHSIPIVLHMHGSQFKKFYQESDQPQRNTIIATLDKVSVILALGAEWEEFYAGITKAKVLSLDNAVFPKLPIKEIKNNTLISSMGVLSERKGTYDIIEAVSRIKGKINKKYKFLIAGDGEIDKVKKKIKELNLEDIFIIPGWVSDDKEIENIYRNSIIYILPSYNEGMPMSILEAMSYGLPIISTNVGSIPSVVKEENGTIINPGDIEQISESILSYLNNLDLLEGISKNNVRKISDKYNINNSIDNLISVYKSIIKTLI